VIVLLCGRFAVGHECHSYQSTTFSADTCKNIGGSYVADNGTCYYHEFSCPYTSIGGQCHPNVLCDTFSCDTCLMYGGYHEPTTRWYVHNLVLLRIPRDKKQLGILLLE